MVLSLLVQKLWHFEVAVVTNIVLPNEKRCSCYGKIGLDGATSLEDA